MSQSSSFKNDFLLRARATGALPADFDEKSIEQTSVEWTGQEFASSGITQPTIYEIHYEIDFQVSPELLVSKFFINRSDPTRVSSCERTVGRVTARIFVNAYTAHAELRDLAAQHIPSKIKSIKIACFVFANQNSSAVPDLARSILDQIPEAQINDYRDLRSNIIPMFEVEMLKKGHVVFDPYLNHFTNWSQPLIWENALRLNESFHGTCGEKRNCSSAH